MALRILMFHRIVDDRPTAFGLPSCYRIRGTALTPDEFERVLDRVRPIVSLARAERALAEGLELPHGCVLTFDDGYLEHSELVAPLLARRAIPATFYVSVGLDGGGAVAPVDAWYWLLDNAVSRTASVPLPNGRVFASPMDTLKAKTTWVSGTPKRAFLDTSPQEQVVMLGALSHSAGVELPSDLAARLYMTPVAWRQLVESGMQLGAHGITHARLTHIGGHQLEREVRASARVVREFNEPVPFAYPNGDFDSSVTATVDRAVVSSAVTCSPRAVQPSDHRLRLPRCFITPASIEALPSFTTV